VFDFLIKTYIIDLGRQKWNKVGGAGTDTPRQKVKIQKRGKSNETIKV
jgi:hypothetical protein